MNFMNLRLTGVSLSVCRLNPTYSFSTDFLGSVSVVFLKLKLQTSLWDGKRSAASILLSLWSLLALEQAVLVGNTMCRALGSVQQDTCPFHLFVTVFCLYLYSSFTWALPDIFLALSCATSLSLFPASLPIREDSTLAVFSQVNRAAVPAWHGLNQKPEFSMHRRHDLIAPRSQLPPLLVALEWSGRWLPVLPGRQRLAPVGWFPACSEHRQALSCAGFLNPRHQPCLGTGLQLCCLQRQTGARGLDSWSFFHKAWREQTSSWPSLWVGSDSWEPSLQLKGTHRRQELALGLHCWKSHTAIRRAQSSWEPLALSLSSEDFFALFFCLRQNYHIEVGSVLWDKYLLTSHCCFHYLQYMLSSCRNVRSLLLTVYQIVAFSRTLLCVISLPRV